MNNQIFHVTGSDTSAYYVASSIYVICDMVTYIDKMSEIQHFSNFFIYDNDFLKYENADGFNLYTIKIVGEQARTTEVYVIAKYYNTAIKLFHEKHEHDIINSISCNGCIKYIRSSDEIDQEIERMRIG